ncbi:hypothetical protein L4D77_22665 [Photobacterium frigidiphilum]|uniref:hypothetical protein n=1 Tax=Photobacterium frigidiphilum TaxID=264736 RepID=UPI003D0C1D03
MISATTRERWNTKTIMMITFLISIVLIVTSLFYPSNYSDWKNVQISVACSILASNLIMFLTSEFMLRSKRRTEIIDKWGVEALYKTRAEMNQSTNLSLTKCKEEVEIAAFGLKGFREAKIEDVQRLLDKGVSIKILTIDSNSSLLDYIDKSESLMVGSTKKSIEDLLSWCESVNDKSKGSKIEIRSYDSLPLDFYFRVDDRVYIGPYLNGLSSQQTISYEFSLGEGYKYWTKYFNKQWDDCK